MSKLIPIYNSDSFAIVDDKDFEWLSLHKWHLTEKGYAVCGVYNPITKKTEKYRMHRMIMMAKKGQIVDHKNRIKLDNQKSNLRFATRTQNMFNSKLPSNNTSGYKWICWDKSRKKYHVSTKINQKKINVGRYDTLEEAIVAVKYKILPLMGEFVPHEYSQI